MPKNLASFLGAKISGSHWELYWESLGDYGGRSCTGVWQALPRVKWTNSLLDGSNCIPFSKAHWEAISQYNYYYYYYYSAMGLIPALLGTQFLFSSSIRETVRKPDKNLYTCIRSPIISHHNSWAYLTMGPLP